MAHLDTTEQTLAYAHDSDHCLACENHLPIYIAEYRCLPDHHFLVNCRYIAGDKMDRKYTDPEVQALLSEVRKRNLLNIINENGRVDKIATFRKLAQWTRKRDSSGAWLERTGAQWKAKWKSLTEKYDKEKLKGILSVESEEGVEFDLSLICKEI